MAVVQIPNLPAAIALSGAEELELVQANVSVRGTVAQIAALISAGGSIILGTTEIIGGTPGDLLLVGAGGVIQQATISQLLAAILATLPTSNPHVVGAWWLNGESISVSQG